MKRKRLLKKIKRLNNWQLLRVSVLVMNMRIIDYLNDRPAAMKFLLLPVMVTFSLYMIVDRIDHPMFDIVIIGAGLSLSVLIEITRMLFEKRNYFSKG